MSALVRRYAHVPLGIVSLLSILAVIAWLLARGVDGVWDPALPGASPAAVALAPVAPEVVRAAATALPPEPAPVVTAPARPAGPPVAPSPSVPAERYALEGGPFASADIAARHEDQLNRLGYATVRFRRQTIARVYVVAATGFATPEDAGRAARELGGGTVVEAPGAAEVLLHRLPTFADAVTRARALRDRGVDVRVGEEVTPTVLYHVRYGQFTSHAAAQARREELMARLGLEDRVVKVR